MSWDLIRSVKDKTDQRLVLPFGLSLKAGDVVSLEKNGNLTLEGDSKSLLAMKAGKPASGAPGNLVSQAGKGTQIKFRAAGTASSLFPELPSASAGFDIEFASANSWLLACVDRVVSTIHSNQFRRPILDAYRRKVWKPDWALIVEVSVAERMTLLASTMAKTNVALSLGATVADTEALEAKLTADVSVAGASSEFTRCIFSEPAVVFVRALRVEDPWWKRIFSGADVGSLARALPKGGAGEAEAAPDGEFWEDVDTRS